MGCIYSIFKITVNIPIVVMVQFNESTYSVNESEGIVQPVLVLNSPPAVDITVYVLSNNGSAVHETDYELETHEVTFHSGDNEATMNITIINDALLGLNRNFTLTINTSSLPSNMTVTEPGNTTVTILNDDCKYKLHIKMMDCEV